MSFEITFLGTSGGPAESGNCAVLVKPAHMSYNEVLASPASLFMIDAGSGWLALAEIILQHSARLQRPLSGVNLYPSCGLLAVPETFPFRDLDGHCLTLSRQVFGKVAALLLSHPHLDHIHSFVLNSAGASKYGHKFSVFGSDFTTNALRTHIFNGVVWPDLESAGTFDLRSFEPSWPFNIINNNYNVTAFELSHGVVTNKGKSHGVYTSSAFLVCDNVTQAKFLSFGDFEADTVSKSNRNATVWSNVAPYVLDGSLKCIILECSSLSVRPEVNLYGHMTPTHLMAELHALDSICGALRPSPLTSLNVFVTHVKDTFEDLDSKSQVLAELRSLSKESDLHLNFSMASPGVSVVI